MPNTPAFEDAVAFLTSLGVIAVSTLMLSFFFGGWSDLVPRGDTAAHMTKVRFILDNWMHFRWGDIWAAGFPMFLWYAPLPYLILSALAVLVGSIQLAFTISVIFAVVLVAYGVYLIAYENGAGHSSSLLVALLAVASPAVWVYGLKGGLFPRLLTLMLWPFSLYLAQRWARKTQTRGPNSSKTYVAFVLVLGAAVQGHVLIGSIVAISVALLLLLTVQGLGRKVHALFSAFAPTLGLSAAFYLPFFLTNPSSRFLALKVSSPPLNFQNLLFDSDLVPYDGEALFPLLLPLFGVLLAVFLRRRGTGTLKRENVRALVGLLLVSAFFAVFAFAGHFGWPSTWYINGFPPGEGSILLAVVLAAATGILMNQLGKRRRVVALSLICLTLVISIGIYSPMNSHPWVTWSRRANDPVIEVTQHGTKIDTVDVNYRYGTDWDRSAIWFNYAYPIPQTRDYYGQGILIEDWRFWFQKAVWVDLDNYNETNYLLDWFAVRWFSVSNPHYHYEKFLARPTQYRLIGNISDPALAALGNPGSSYYMFERTGATPILSASNAPAVLIIGSRNAYSVLFRSLSYLDYDSQRMIPVMGSEYVDDYSPTELSEFDAVMLYGYQYRDRNAAFKIIERYVEEGGRLIVDTGLSPQANDKDPPKVFPVASLDATNFGTTWSLSRTTSPIVAGVRFDNFSSAVYGEFSPWGVSIASNSTLRDWAQPLVYNHGRPIAAAGEYGKGRVAWMGFNLPYHAESYKNPDETQLIIDLFGWATDVDDSNLHLSYSASRENAEFRSVQLNQQARGILMKESIFENWHAYAVDANGKRHQLEICEAGPSFMYARLPEGIAYPSKAVLEYNLTWPEYLGFSITILTVLLLLLSPVIGRGLPAPFRRRVNRVWSEEE